MNRESVWNIEPVTHDEKPNNPTCKLNGVEPESYLRYVLDVIADWPINRVGELLPWRVALPTE
nr:transposase domain-containing protein [Escherichia coli]